MLIQPVNNRVIIKPDAIAAETSAKSGLLMLPPETKEKPTMGEIMAVCDKAIVEVGNRVMFTKYAGTIIKVAGKEMLLLNQDEIVAILG